MSSVSPELAPLIHSIAQGDRIAFRRLYDLTASKLLGLILRMIKNRAAADDVLQDVFLRIWRNAPRYSPELGAPMAWLATIARNRTIDVLRQRSDIGMDGGEDGEDWFSRIADPKNHESELMDASSLRHCLGQMDPEKRACVLGAYYEGRSREELAVQFGQPVNTIKTWLHRSLAALKICLETN